MSLCCSIPAELPDDVPQRVPGHCNPEEFPSTPWPCCFQHHAAMAQKGLDPVPGCEQSPVLSRSFLGSMTLRGEIQSLRPRGSAAGDRQHCPTLKAERRLSKYPYHPPVPCPSPVPFPVPVLALLGADAVPGPQQHRGSSTPGTGWVPGQPSSLGASPARSALHPQPPAELVTLLPMPAERGEMVLGERLAHPASPAPSRSSASSALPQLGWSWQHCAVVLPLALLWHGAEECPHARPSSEHPGSPLSPSCRPHLGLRRVSLSAHKRSEASE